MGTTPFYGKTERWAILVVEPGGETHYLHDGCDGNSGRVSIFRSKQKAKDQAEFLRDGLGDEVQSVNVVTYPSKISDRKR